jgi:hypothetical protein
MRKSFLRIILSVVLLGFAPMAYAQDEERPEFKMPCEQALKVGLEKFMDVYGEKTQDYSTVGQKMAFEYWVNCKRPANDALAAKLLSEDKRQQISAVREGFNKFGSALWGLRYMESGGGTMWGLISVGSYAERENFMETLIKTLAMTDSRLPRARRNVNASLTKIQRLLEDTKIRQPFTEGSEPDEVAQRNQTYQENIKETRDALANLRVILSALPDATAERLALKMAEEAKSALEEESP